MATESAGRPASLFVGWAEQQGELARALTRLTIHGRPFIRTVVAEARRELGGVATNWASDQFRERPSAGSPPLTALLGRRFVILSRNEHRALSGPRALGSSSQALARPLFPRPNIVKLPFRASERLGTPSESRSTRRSADSGTSSVTAGRQPVAAGCSEREPRAQGRGVAEEEKRIMKISRAQLIGPVARLSSSGSLEPLSKELERAQIWLL